MPRLVQPLPDGPLDIIGDVHGEIEALRSLLWRLGGDPEARRLSRPAVFVGDLVDRGPDSPAVVRLVRDLVEAGQAFCIAGNHELNLLEGSRKEGNGWYFDDPGDQFSIRRRTGVRHLTFGSTGASPDEVVEIEDFLASLPLVLERADLRVVHACWHAPAVAALPASADLATLATQLEGEIQARLEAEGVLARAAAQRGAFAGLFRLDVPPTQMCPDVGRQDLIEQNDNPVHVLVSGREEPLDFEDVFYVGGRWRFVTRSTWWESYTDEPAVVVGHYWRRRGSPIAGKVDVWRTPDPWHWAGPTGRVFCVDYSVGRRFYERAIGRRGDFDGGLAALRWPERVLVFDDRDEVVPTVGYGRGSSRGEP